MSPIKCRLCGQNSSYTYEKNVLGKYNVKYYSCDHCQYFQTEKPYWLKEAYESVINNEDTGIFRRNIFLSNFLLSWLFFNKNKNFQYLDFSGGYGILSRLMLDEGFEFYWTDQFCENLFAKNYTLSNKVIKPKLVTCFEVLEHIEYPADLIKNLFEFNNEVAIISTETFVTGYPDKSWWYLGENHGQHIGFFNNHSIEYLAKKLDLNVISHKNVHIFSKNKMTKIYLKFCFFLARTGLPKVAYRFLGRKPLE